MGAEVMQASRALAVVMLLGLLAACARPAAAPSPCVGWAPIRPTEADIAVMSDDLIAQILTMNETGARLCGWTP